MPFIAHPDSFRFSAACRSTLSPFIFSVVRVLSSCPKSFGYGLTIHRAECHVADDSIDRALAALLTGLNCTVVDDSYLSAKSIELLLWTRHALLYVRRDAVQLHKTDYTEVARYLRLPAFISLRCYAFENFLLLIFEGKNCSSRLGNNRAKVPANYWRAYFPRCTWQLAN